MTRIVRAALLLLLMGGLAACATPPGQPSSPATPAGSVAPTSAPASATDSQQGEEPTDDDAGELHDYGYDSNAGREAGQRVSDLLADLADRHSKVRYGFSAAVKKVSVDLDADENKVLTIVFDRLTWNPEFTDGGEAEPTVNPTVKWENLHSPEIIALASPGSGKLVMSTDQLINYVSNRVSQGRDSVPYFSFYFEGNTLVAIDEWFLP